MKRFLYCGPCKSGASDGNVRSDAMILTILQIFIIIRIIEHSGKKSLMNQENAYSNGCKVKYLLKSKISVDLVSSICGGIFPNSTVGSSLQGILHFAREDKVFFFLECTCQGI